MSAPSPMLLLVLMIRNESAILKRCLDAAAPAVDAILIADTGSTDNTCEIAEQYHTPSKPVRVVHHTWKNFGHNRTLSMDAANAWVLEKTAPGVEESKNEDDLQWPSSPRDILALVLDADMVLAWHGDSPAGFRAYLAAHPHITSFCLQQKTPHLEYYNIRLMRMSVTWKCSGVTHEAWGSDTEGFNNRQNIPATVAYIKDVSDGGCKADKFPRDLALLTQGLIDEPGNVRYMFYLAQTQKDMGKHADAIKSYKARIRAGGWAEEVWYAHYMIARCWLHLSQQPGTDETAALIKAETWVARGQAYRPTRTEAMLMFATHLRERGKQHGKAWFYVQEAAKQPRTPDVLFVEPGCYPSPDGTPSERVLYERVILAYYVFGDGDKAPGRKACLQYQGGNTASVYRNLHWYIEQLPGVSWHRLCVPQEMGWVSSSIGASAHTNIVNVRSVNYKITSTGAYEYPMGTCGTRNFMTTYDFQRRALAADTAVEVNLGTINPAIPKSPMAFIKGLEDVRLGADGVTWTATTREFIDGAVDPGNRIVYGRCYPDLKDARTVASPHNNVCEKNWLPLDDGRVIYGWKPLLIGKVVPREDDAGRANFEAVATYESGLPWLFSHARGSAPPMLYKGQLWTLIHYCMYECTPRVYLHGWIVLDAGSLKPVAYTPPFYLRHKGIEYSCGVALDPVVPDTVHIFTSVWDRESWVGVVSMVPFVGSFIKL